MLEPYDPYLELTAKLKTESELSEQAVASNPNKKKGRSILGSIILITLGAIITVIVINERLKQKQRLIELKRKKEPQKKDNS